MTGLPNPCLPLEVAKRWFSCDFSKGVLRWRKGRRSGHPAGTVKPHGYRIVNVNKKSYPVHRIIWMMYSGQDPHPLCIDHANGVRSDNRISNLRLATQAQNTQNQKTTSRNTSGYKGVSYMKARGTWDARIMKNRKIYGLGAFATKEEAYAAYCEAAQALHGDFARLA